MQSTLPASKGGLHSQHAVHYTLAKEAIMPEQQAAPVDVCTTLSAVHHASLLAATAQGQKQEGAHCGLNVARKPIGRLPLKP